MTGKSSDRDGAWGALAEASAAEASRLRGCEVAQNPRARWKKDGRGMEAPLDKLDSLH